MSRDSELARKPPLPPPPPTREASAFDGGLAPAAPAAAAKPGGQDVDRQCADCGLKRRRLREAVFNRWDGDLVFTPSSSTSSPLPCDRGGGGGCCKCATLSRRGDDCSRGPDLRGRRRATSTAEAASAENDA
eukprot:INCI17513.2.p4 GENE.INCI17513.2~~INCI17513.2.p4  ORF type:complete len:132 (+),score=24.85 INCI17513.2:455-850(+)